MNSVCFLYELKGYVFIYGEVSQGGVERAFVLGFDFDCLVLGLTYGVALQRESEKELLIARLI